MIWLEGVQHVRFELDVRSDAVVDVVVHRPFQPAIRVQYHVDVNQTGLQGSGHWLNDGTIVFTVTSTDDQQFVVQLVLANHVIEDQLVGSSLYRTTG